MGLWAARLENCWCELCVQGSEFKVQRPSRFRTQKVEPNIFSAKEARLPAIMKRMLLLFAVAFVVSGIQTTANAQAKAPIKVRLATSTAGLDFAPIWIAQRKGYFKEEGID